MTKAAAIAMLAATLAAPLRAYGAEIAPLSVTIDPWVVTVLAKDAGASRIEAYKVDKNLVAWTELNGSVRTLYAFDGVQTRTLASMDKNDWIDDGNGFYDAVSGNFDVADGMVVWTMSDGHDREIYAFNGEGVAKVSDNTYDDRHPVVSQGRIAWTSAPSPTSYNLMIKDKFGVRRLAAWPVLNYAFSGPNIYWLNKLPNEDWFRAFVNVGLASSAIGKGDDRPMSKYFFTDGNGSAAWEYSTKNWSYDKREIFVSTAGAPAFRVLQRDVPPMVTRIEDMHDGVVMVNVTDLLLTDLEHRTTLSEIAGAITTAVWRKEAPTKVRYMDGGYVRHREPDSNSPLVYHAPDHEDFITLDAVINDRFDADGSAAAGARVGGGLVTYVAGKPSIIPSNMEASSLAVKNGSIAWVEGQSGAQTLKFATTSVLVSAQWGARMVPGHLVKSTGGSAVYLAANDGKRYLFNGPDVYFTWYKDFNTVETLSPASLAAMPLGGTVLYKPGTRLLKTASSPRIYMIGNDGQVHWLTSMDLVVQNLGPSWLMRLVQIDDASLANYPMGAPVTDQIRYFAYAPSM